MREDEIIAIRNDFSEKESRSKMEKVYKLMNNTGIASVAMGVVVIVVGITVGVLTIVGGIRLIINKKEITF